MCRDSDEFPHKRRDFSAAVPRTLVERLIGDFFLRDDRTREEGTPITWVRKEGFGVFVRDLHEYSLGRKPREPLELGKGGNPPTRNIGPRREKVKSLNKVKPLNSK